MNSKTYNLGLVPEFGQALEHLKRLAAEGMTVTFKRVDGGAEIEARQRDALVEAAREAEELEHPIQSMVYSPAAVASLDVDVDITLSREGGPGLKEIIEKYTEMPIRPAFLTQEHKTIEQFSMKEPLSPQILWRDVTKGDIDAQLGLPPLSLNITTTAERCGEPTRDYDVRVARLARGVYEIFMSSTCTLEGGTGENLAYLLGAILSQSKVTIHPGSDYDEEFIEILKENFQGDHDVWGYIVKECQGDNCDNEIDEPHKPWDEPEPCDACQEEEDEVAEYKGRMFHEKTDRPDPLTWRLEESPAIGWWRIRHRTGGSGDMRTADVARYILDRAWVEVPEPIDGKGVLLKEGDKVKSVAGLGVLGGVQGVVTAIGPNISEPGEDPRHTSNKVIQVEYYRKGPTDYKAIIGAAARWEKIE